VSHFGNAFDALNKEKYRAELFRIAPFLAEVGEDLNHYIDTYLNFEKHYPNYLRYPAGAGSIEILHLVSPRRIIGDGNGNVIGIELERGKLVSTENGHDYKGIGEKFILPVDTVIRSVGGIADQSLGLPTRFDRVVTKNTEDQSIRRPSEIGNPERYWKTRTLAHYEVDFNQFSVLPTARVFVAGWARLPGVGASDEIDFSAIPDGRNLGKLLVAELASLRNGSEDSLEVMATKVRNTLDTRGCAYLLQSMGIPIKRPHLPEK
jgi:hypothetical protein